jgi:hypothetical protein
MFILPVKTRSTELARPILEFYATLFKLPMINVVSKQSPNPKLFSRRIEITGRTSIKTQIPPKHTEILSVREYFSANFGTRIPHIKLPKNKGIGNKMDTSPYSSVGYFYEKNSMAVRIAFHPISEAIPSIANVNLCVKFISDSSPMTKLAKVGINLVWFSLI